MTTGTISSIRPRRHRPQISPLELLLNVTLPLIPILAIAVFIHQAHARSSDGRYPLIIELQRQKLINRIEHVLDNLEERLCLAAFPDSEAAVGLFDTGFSFNASRFALHSHFATMCRESCKADVFGRKKQTNDLIESLYKKALDLDIGGETWQPNYVTTENRQYAIQRIREQVNEIQTRIVDLQFIAVEAALKKQPEQFAAPSRIEVEKKIQDSFAAAGMPLLPYLF